MWNLQLKIILLHEAMMKEYTIEDSSHGFSLHTDSYLATLNLVAQYVRP
jgi:hypothetical protein